MSKNDPALQASRAAARLRVRAAMQHVEAAQNELRLASADLSAIYGFASVQDAVRGLSLKVRAVWYRLNSMNDRAIGASLSGSTPFATLDSLTAPNRAPQADEHAHKGCGNQVGGVSAHGLLHSTPVPSRRR